MISEEPIFWKYLIFNDDGIAGIKSNAPEDAKKAYIEYVERDKRLNDAGIKE